MKTIALILCLSWGLMAKSQSLSLVYIDSSQPVSEDFMSIEELGRIEQLITAELDTSRLFVFYSNGSKYRFARSETQRNDILDRLYTSPASEPNWQEDKRLLRDYMYPEVKGFKGALEFHVFLSDDKADEVMTGESSLVKLLPKELIALSDGRIAQTEVNVYYSDSRGKLDAERMEESLNFFNTPEYGPVIVYRVNIIK